MYDRSSLSEEQRRAAVTLFDAGWGRDSAARRLGVSKDAIRRLYDRWRVRGGAALVTKPTKRLFSFEFKLDVVHRRLAGESKVDLAKELGLSSPALVQTWVHKYRVEGEEGLRPKAKGRPKTDPGTAAAPESEVQRLRRENERLRAEVAFLGKVQALGEEGRR
jgi:transposase